MAWAKRIACPICGNWMPPKIVVLDEGEELDREAVCSLCEVVGPTDAGDPLRDGFDLIHGVDGPDNWDHEETRTWEM